MNIYIKNIVRFILAILVQVLLINQLDLGTASPYFYPLFYAIFVILLPLNVSPIYLILFGFTEGFIIDLFMNTGGLHASSLVMLAFARPYVLKLISPREDYDPTKPISISFFGFRKFFLYVFILSAAQHLWFFSLEYFKWNVLHVILAKTIVSTSLATILILLTDYLTARSNK